MEARKLEPELPIRCVLRAMALGAAFAAAVGAAECGKLLFSGAPRYGEIAAQTALLGLVGYTLLGALLGGACGALAWLLWRRPEFRAASASTCAGLGTFAAIAAFVVLPQVGAVFLLPAAVGATLIALLLRELLAWTPRLWRPAPWVALGALVLLAGALTFSVRGGATAGARTTAAVSAPRPNVLLVTIDTLRRDHLGCYGSENAKTPTIDALAAESVRFLDATSQANTTGPSHTTILTGMYPNAHGAVSNGVRVSSDVRTLPELLSQAGFSTGASVSGFTLCQGACGLAPRFEYYDDDLCAWPWMPEVAGRLRLFRVIMQVANLSGLRPERADRPANETIDSALAWLDSRDRSRPFFLWTHLFDPHAPYEPPPPFDRMHAPETADVPTRNWYTLSTQERRALVSDPRQVEHMRALYRGEISFVDREVGRLVERLRASGEFENTLVILTSDHGEGLGEHGYWFDHGTFLYDTELSVPLLIRFPGAKDAGRQVAEQVRLLDLTPTVLDSLGLEIPTNLSGLSLLPALHGSGAGPRPSYAQGELSGLLSGYDLDGRKLSLRNNGRKLIWTSDHWLDSVRIPESWELYDLGRDPGEQSDALGAKAPVTAEGPILESAADMREHLQTWRELTAEDETRKPLTPEVREQLKNLGYL